MKEMREHIFKEVDELTYGDYVRLIYEITRLYLKNQDNEDE